MLMTEPRTERKLNAVQVMEARVGTLAAIDRAPRVTWLDPIGGERGSAVGGAGGPSIQSPTLPASFPVLRYQSRRSLINNMRPKTDIISKLCACYSELEVSENGTVDSCDQHDRVLPKVSRNYLTLICNTHSQQLQSLYLNLFCKGSPYKIHLSIEKYPLNLSYRTGGMKPTYNLN